MGWQYGNAVCGSNSELLILNQIKRERNGEPAALFLFSGVGCWVKQRVAEAGVSKSLQGLCGVPIPGLIPMRRDGACPDRNAVKHREVIHIKPCLPQASPPGLLWNFG